MPGPANLINPWLIPQRAVIPAGVAPSSVTTVAASGTTLVTNDNSLVLVSQALGAIVQIGQSLTRLTIKDISGSNNPIIGVNVQQGGALEDPNNINGVPQFTTVYIKQAGAAVIWQVGPSAGAFYIVSTTS